ncbi:MAG: copper homeostasis membrane protein CopD [Brevundimonas aurantiaca]|jgi:putative copper resistance protein D|uniref:copper homeostasis membrane protein CopD n=1 Tax=Brevundimonas aurantiaca TaxID=74316 RepID=UPI002FDD0CA3
MIELAVIALRGVQYALISLTFGLPAFVLLNRPHLDERALQGLRAQVGWATGAMVVVVPIAILAQTALMAGSWSGALDPQALLVVVTGMGLGVALAVRWVAALAEGLLFAFRLKGRGFWFPAVLLGLVSVVTLAWTGHGAATEGVGRFIHQGSTAVHAAAAAFWIGALAAFLWLAFRPIEPGSEEEARAAAMLTGFAGSGTVAVAILVATGLVNTAFLVGPSRVLQLPQSLYGGLLILKLGLFLLMLALAALHRFQLAPQMEARSAHALTHLRRSLLVEFVCGGLILALVALLGTLPPPMAM